MVEFATIPEIFRRGEVRIPKDVWDYADGAAETEATLRRNRWGLDALALKTRVLQGVENRTTETTFLGHRLKLPVMTAPVGGIARFDPRGTVAMVNATDRVGTAAFVSTVALPAVEELASQTDGLRFFQLYAYGDREWCADLMRRVEGTGFSGIAITVDSAVYGRRDRDLRNRFSGRTLGRGNFDVMDHGAIARLSWDDIRFLRDRTKLPLMLKGVMNPDDAAQAVECGVDVIYVSNHGGRELDQQPGTIQVLPEIVAAVNGRAKVIVDGGFRRGTDVVKALALGASAVLVGRPLCWALGAAGEEGLVRFFELLHEELMVVMALMGVKSVDQLDPSYLRPVTPL